MVTSYIRHLERFNDWRKQKISPANFLIIAAAITGVLGGISSSILKELTHFIANFLQNDFHWRYKYFLYLLFPLTGIFLTILYVQLFIRRNKFQSGIPALLFNISRNGSRLHFHNIYSQVITSAFTVGMGGSAGLEAPAASSGAAIGSNAGKWFGLNYRETTLLLACGAAAGISGAFISPIAGMAFAIEVILPEFSIPAAAPLLISAALAAVISKLIRSEPLFVHVAQGWVLDALGSYIVFGILVGLYSVFYSKLNHYCFDLFNKVKSRYRKAWIGGLSLGVMIALLPALYGEGYITIQKLLNGNYASLLGNSLFPQYQNVAWALVLFGTLTLVGKTFASVMTMASGGNGGMFGPSVVIGGLLGFVFAFGINQTAAMHLNVTNFMIAGMAASVSGVMHAPLTGIFLAAEITGGYMLMVPLMIVSALSYFINKGILKYSIYTKKLAEQGALFSQESKDDDVLKNIDLNQLIENDFVVLRPDDTPKSRCYDIVHTHRNVFPVVDLNGKLTGLVFSDRLLEMLISTNEPDHNRLVKDIAQPAQRVIKADMQMASVMQMMDSQDLRILPVTDNEGTYMGFVSKNNIFSKYRTILMQQSIL